MEPALYAFNTSSPVELLDDIERPAWTTISLSESCGSHLSHISSLCSEIKLSENIDEWSFLRNVPECSSPPKSTIFNQSSQSAVVPASELRRHHCPNRGRTEAVPHMSSVEDGSKLTISEFAKSPSSSTKTLCSSPKSDDGKYAQHSQVEAVKHYGPASTFRERAPSDNALDFRSANLLRESKHSYSLHDVSNIPSLPRKLSSPDRYRTGQSLSALSVRNRSRDSGFGRSESLVSLSSGGRNYEHVQSKVKMYIQSIKQADASRRKQRESLTSSANVSPKPSPPDALSSTSAVDLAKEVEKMKADMADKDRLLLKLQEDYNTLLYKYAEAENRIDRLRFSYISASPFDTEVSKPKKCVKKLFMPVAHEEVRELKSCDSPLSYSFSGSNNSQPIDLSTLQSSLSSDKNTEKVLQSTKHRVSSVRKKQEQKKLLISAPLNPITSLYSSSVRLDSVKTPLSSKKSDVSDVSCTVARDLHPFTQNKLLTNKSSHVLKAGTTDTGIGDCCPLSTEEEVECNKAEPIHHLPGEDLFMKVQRWQNSLPPCCGEGSCSNNHGTKRISSDSGFHQSQSRMRIDPSPMDRSKRLPHHKRHSVGLQVKLDFDNSLISSSSPKGNQMKPSSVVHAVNSEETDVLFIPQLNLEGLSDENGDCTESLLLSSNNNAFPKVIEGRQDNTFSSINSGSAPCGNACSVLPRVKHYSCNQQEACVGTCAACGESIETNQKCQASILRSCQAFHGSMRLRSERFEFEQASPGVHNVMQAMSPLSKDQDHVVPSTPKVQQSFECDTSNTAQESCSCNKSIDRQTYVSLRGTLHSTVSHVKCTCHQNFSPSPLHLPKSACKSDIMSNDYQPLTVSEQSKTQTQGVEDSPLLQCLNEMDDYASQLWDKTVSFLEVLNNKKQSA